MNKQVIIAGSLALLGVLLLSTKPVAAEETGYTCYICGQHFDTYADYMAHFMSLVDVVGDPHYQQRIPIEIKWS